MVEDREGLCSYCVICAPTSPPLCGHQVRINEVLLEWTELLDAELLGVALRPRALLRVLREGSDNARGLARADLPPLARGVYR